MLVKEKARVWVAGPEQLEPRGGLAAVPAGAEEIDCTLELLSMNQVGAYYGCRSSCVHLNGLSDRTIEDALIC